MRRSALPPKPGTVGAVLAASLGLAASLPMATAADAPSMLESLRRSGADVTPLGTSHGLDGFLVRPEQEPPWTLYVTPDGASLVGQLYDADGVSVSRRQLAEILANAGTTKSPETSTVTASGPQAPLLAASAAAGYRVVGGQPEIIVFADPACLHSRDWLDTLRRAAPGRFGLRLVPVARLGEWSARASMWVIDAADPVAAFRQVAGRYLSDSDINPAASRELAANNRLFAAWQANAVPFSVYRTGDGSVRRLEGTVADLRRFLPQPEGHR